MNIDRQITPCVILSVQQFNRSYGFEYVARSRIFWGRPPAELGEDTPNRVLTLIGFVMPDILRDLLSFTADQVLTFATVGDDHSQDFQHGIGEIRVLSTHAEANLSKHLSM